MHGRPSRRPRARRARRSARGGRRRRAPRATPAPARTRTTPRAGAACARPRRARPSRPSEPYACDISTPTTPPPRITIESGISLAVVASRLVHASSIWSRPSIGGIAGSVPPARKTALRASSSSVPPSWSSTVTRPLAGHPPAAAHERDPAVLEPRQLRGVVEVVDDLVAAGEHAPATSSSPVDGLRRARDPAHLGERLVGPQQRLRGHARPERALAADEPVLDDRHLEARRPRACPPPPRRPARRRSRSRRKSACGGTIRGALGTTWLRRGRFARAVASRGAGGLVKPRQHHKCG